MNDRPLPAPGRRARLLAAIVLPLLIGGAAVASALSGGDAAPYARPPTSPGPIDPTAIPLGDGYLTTVPKIGYVDTCTISFGGIGGAAVAGPWIDTRTRTWDETTKLAVNGAVEWPNASFTITVAGAKRVIRFNDLPLDHPTGVFPIGRDDPAYAYDRNPNQIEPHTVSWRVPLHPAAATRPSCTAGEPIGVLSDGVFLYNALDGEGRDAAAHELLDACGGHPDPSGSYHHHDVPACILDRTPNARSTLVGYALDGYGIYVVKDAEGAMPSNTQLDACHGTTSVVPWDGRPTRIYHYVATLEYPYTIGCFHGTPISAARGPAGASPP